MLKEYRPLITVAIAAAMVLTSTAILFCSDEAHAAYDPLFIILFPVNEHPIDFYENFSVELYVFENGTLVDADAISASFLSSGRVLHYVRASLGHYFIEDRLMPGDNRTGIGNAAMSVKVQKGDYYEAEGISIDINHSSAHPYYMFTSITINGNSNMVPGEIGLFDVWTTVTENGTSRFMDPATINVSVSLGFMVTYPNIARYDVGKYAFTFQADANITSSLEYTIKATATWGAPINKTDECRRWVEISFYRMNLELMSVTNSSASFDVVICDDVARMPVEGCRIDMMYLYRVNGTRMEGNGTGVTDEYGHAPFNITYEGNTDMRVQVSCNCNCTYVQDLVMTIEVPRENSISPKFNVMQAGQASEVSEDGEYVNVTYIALNGTSPVASETVYYYCYNETQLIIAGAALTDAQGRFAVPLRAARLSDSLRLRFEYFNGAYNMLSNGHETMFYDGYEIGYDDILWVYMPTDKRNETWQIFATTVKPQYAVGEVANVMVRTMVAGEPLDADEVTLFIRTGDAPDAPVEVVHATKHAPGIFDASFEVRAEHYPHFEITVAVAKGGELSYVTKDFYVSPSPRASRADIVPAAFFNMPFSPGDTVPLKFYTFHYGVKENVLDAKVLIREKIIDDRARFVEQPYYNEPQPVTINLTNVAPGEYIANFTIPEGLDHSAEYEYYGAASTELYELAGLSSYFAVSMYDVCLDVVERAQDHADVSMHVSDGKTNASIAGASVALSYRTNTNAFVVNLTAATDANGKATFRIDHAGAEKVRVFGGVHYDNFTENFESEFDTGVSNIEYEGDPYSYYSPIPRFDVSYDDKSQNVDDTCTYFFTARSYLKPMPNTRINYYVYPEWNPNCSMNYGSFAQGNVITDAQGRFALTFDHSQVRFSSFTFDAVPRSLVREPGHDVRYSRAIEMDYTYVITADDDMNPYEVDIDRLNVGAPTVVRINGNFTQDAYCAFGFVQGTTDYWRYSTDILDRCAISNRWKTSPASRVGDHFEGQFTIPALFPSYGNYSIVITMFDGCFFDTYTIVLPVNGSTHKGNATIAPAPVITNVTALANYDDCEIKWDVNVIGTSYVDWGDTLGLGNITSSGMLATNFNRHAVLSGLTEGTKYYFKIYALNVQGNVSIYEGDFTTSLTLDVTPPALLNVSLDEDADAHELAIAITTDENTTAALNYGTTSSFGNAREDANLATTHNWTISGLEGSTTYYYSIVVRDSSGNANYTNGTFTTRSYDNAAPKITGVITSSDARSITVTWLTDENATCYVEYGKTGAYGNASDFTSPVRGHKAILKGLESGKKYHFRIVAKDASNNTARTDDMTLSTKEMTTGAFEELAVILALTVICLGVILYFSMRTGKKENVNEKEKPRR